MLSDVNRVVLRKQMRHKRRALTRAERRTAAEKLDRRIARDPDFLKSRHIAVYLANDGEIDLLPLIRRCWRLRKKVYLPVLDPLGHNRLRFVEYRANTVLKKNRFNILEPRTQAKNLPPWALSLVLMPLVAFDARGARLGMGGGFYDRTFAFKDQNKAIQRVRLMGVAYEIQRVEKVPKQSWDISMCSVISEKASYPKSGAGSSRRY